MENEIKKFVAIYSVGTNGTGIDDLDKGKKGIYIYENSLDDLKNIKKGDIICFIQTKLGKITLFEFKEKDKKNDRNYIVLPSEKVYIFNNISIGDFKNLYFLNFDNLKSWVRSPLATKKNILILEKGNEILEDFKNLEKLENVFNNINIYLRKYFIGDYNNLKNKDDKKIYLDYKNGVFGKEFSAFYKDGLDNNLTDKTLKQALKEIENKNSLKYLNILQEESSCVINSYSAYYDLTRSFELSEELDKFEDNIEDLKEKIKLLKNKIEYSNELEKEVLEKQIEEYKSEKEVLEDMINDLKSKELTVIDNKENLIKTIIKEKIKELNNKYKKYKMYFNIGIGIIIIYNLILLVITIKFNLNKENFIQEFLSKGIYLFSIEFLVLYISYFYFNLSNKYLLISEIYSSYQLLSDIREWSALEIEDEEFKKENIRKLFEIQNVVELSFNKNNTKMPMMELLDTLSKVKNLNK